MRRRGLWVFSRLNGDLLSYASALKDLNKIYKRAGVTVPVSDLGETRPWHSLRHSFGTECAARGMPITTLQELMGHEDVETTRRYVTVTTEHKREAMRLVFGAERQPVGNTLPAKWSK
jgi:site-specific recombinase XerD